MKPFNLEQALAGKPVVTRDGRKVLEIISFNSKNLSKPVMAWIEGVAEPYPRRVDGTMWSGPAGGDLFMDSEKKTGWMNLYNLSTPYGGKVHNTKEAADVAGQGRIACVKIEWEE